jgi:diguanylate cyclase (GGDEF)-like protein
MFRFHLLDIQLVARRGLIFTALAASLLVVFYVALGIGWTVLSRVLDGDFSPWLLAAVTLLLGLLYAPLREALQAVIDQRFFPERVALRQQLVHLAADLPAQGALPRMGHYLADHLCAIFGARSASVFLTDPTSGILLLLASRPAPPGERELTLLLDASDPGLGAIARSRRPWTAREAAAASRALNQRIQVLNSALVVPMLLGKKLSGLILLGDKQEPQDYPAEELELLELLSHHIATVFENVRLFESATIESLTGLYRREAILERLEIEIHRAVRYRRPLSVCMIDLDNFKRINDTYGHLAGDGVLQRVGQTLGFAVRATDSVGRYGGEEFLLVLPETSLEEAVVVADKARQGIARISYLNDDGSHVTVTASIGVAALREVSITGEEVTTTLLAAADHRLLEAKRSGRNRIEPSRSAIA